MAGQEGEPERFATGPVTADLAAQEALTEQARQLRQQHRDAAITPFGDAHYVYWDEGSARLLSALGVTSATTDDNWAGRVRMVAAYCDALEAPEAGEIEPGSLRYLPARAAGRVSESEVCQHRGQLSR